MLKISEKANEAKDNLNKNNNNGWCGSNDDNVVQLTSHRNHVE